ncbi:MAG: hypothetical protein AAFV51_00885 [Pseudomonadota bacterium]
MGLQVATIARLPIEGSRDYYIYLLDYGWDEPIAEALRDNFEFLAKSCSENNAVIVKGFDAKEFNNEVFAYHSIDGEAAVELLPALLVTKTNPAYFAQDVDQRWTKAYKVNEVDNFILVPVRKFCKKASEVPGLLDSIMKDISEGESLCNFQVSRQVARKESRFSWLMLEPNIYGVGVRMPKLFEYLRRESR